MGNLTFVSRELKITFNEKVYCLRYPTVEDIRGYNKKLHAKGAIELEVVTEMLSTLGLPKAVVGKMEVPFIEAIVEELTAKKKVVDGKDAVLAKFMHYYHYKYDEVMMLDMPTYQFLIDAMNLAQSQRDISVKALVSYPHMDKETRSKMDARLRLNATTKEMRAESSITTDQLKVAGVSIGNISDVIKGK